MTASNGPSEDFHHCKRMAVVILQIAGMERNLEKHNWKEITRNIMVTCYLSFNKETLAQWYIYNNNNKA